MDRRWVHLPHTVLLGGGRARYAPVCAATAAAAVAAAAVALDC